jgi:hypothetical protein
VTNVRVRVFSAGLLARIQLAYGRSCDRPTRSSFSVVFLGPRENSDFLPKFYDALQLSHAVLTVIKSIFRVNEAPSPY